MVDGARPFTFRMHRVNIRGARTRSDANKIQDEGGSAELLFFSGPANADQCIARDMDFEKREKSRTHPDHTPATTALDCYSCASGCACSLWRSSVLDHVDGRRPRQMHVMECSCWHPNSLLPKIRPARANTTIKHEPCSISQNRGVQS